MRTGGRQQKRYRNNGKRIRSLSFFFFVLSDAQLNAKSFEFGANTAKSTKSCRKIIIKKKIILNLDLDV